MPEVLSHFLEMEEMLLSPIFDLLPSGLDESIFREEVSLAIYLEKTVLGSRAVFSEILHLSVFRRLPAAARQNGDPISSLLVCFGVLAVASITLGFV